ncbi:hypothetical protein MUK42_26938 [Musa troglodytarum]|uniref:Uncharacterized protein n=1 Tax=Musa troglodytarum TaxID=320322 RepID=A0A9E7FGC8_9LILI|nr:hypothetical protein MUK42_26938 [Musa troglodytarum]
MVVHSCNPRCLGEAAEHLSFGLLPCVNLQDQLRHIRPPAKRAQWGHDYRKNNAKGMYSSPGDKRTARKRAVQIYKIKRSQATVDVV